MTRVAMTAIGGTYVLANVVMSAATALRSSGGQASRPPGTVSIVLPVWHEETDTILRTINSLRSQNVVLRFPGFFEFILLGCDGIDVENIATYVDNVLCIPEGKLTARHAGFLNSDRDIIVSVDGDTFYPGNWLNLMLKPFNVPSVVATTSRTFLPYDLMFYVMGLMYYSGKMIGRGSCIRRSAYFDAGGFDLDIDQSDWIAMEREEEWGFFDRLSQIGQVVYVNAYHYTISRPSTPSRLRNI